MVLPVAPNSISLNEMHVEAGGTSGTNATINDSDIRELIDEPAGVFGSNSLSFNQWYGAEANIAGQAVLTVGTNGSTTYTLPVGVQTCCILIVTDGANGYTHSNAVSAGWGGAGGNLSYWNHISVNGAGANVAPELVFNWNDYINWQSPYYDIGSKIRVKWWPGGSNTPYTTWNQDSGAQFQDQAHTGKGIKMERTTSTTQPGEMLYKYINSWVYRSTCSDSPPTIRGGRGGYGVSGSGAAGGAAGYINATGTSTLKANSGSASPTDNRSGGDGGTTQSTGGSSGVATPTGYSGLSGSGAAGGATGGYAHMYGQGVGKGAGGGGVGILGPGSTGAGGAAGYSTYADAKAFGGSGGSGGQDGGTVTRQYNTFGGSGGYYGSGGGGGQSQFGSGGLYGGGGGGGGAWYPYGPSSGNASGAPGAVRIMWGNNREYPSTNVADQ